MVGCNKDCFNCPYPDCICRENGTLELTIEEKAEINRRRCRASYQKHREKRLAKQSAYYQEHKAERIKYQKEYNRMRKAEA